MINDCVTQESPKSLCTELLATVLMVHERKLKQSMRMGAVGGERVKQ